MTDQTHIQEAEALFKLGAHLGHKKNRLHPKSKKYLYSVIDGVSVIDLAQTVQQMNKAKNVLAEAGKEGKVVLVVATKKVASTYTSDLCKELGVAFITTKWMPGLLTNFDTLIKNVRKFTQMKEQQANGEWDQFVKHERMKMAKEMTRLEKLYGGLEKLTKKPDVLLIVDIKKEKNAVIEAKAYNIPVVAMVDTNSNPEEVGFPIIVNDDAPAVVEFVVNELVQTYAKARA
jgi:small subunit ribosomal protein S2